MLTTETTFSDIVEEVTGESQYTVLAFARTITDPWSYIESVIEDLTPLTQEYEEEFDEFKQTCQEFLDTVDTSLVDKDRLAIQHDHWHNTIVEPNINSESFDPGYSPLQMRRDQWGYGSPRWVTEPNTLPSGGNKNSIRNEWRRTAGPDKDLRVLVDYGNFDLAITEGAAKHALKVRTHMRTINNVKVHFLSVGGVEINMHSGEVSCRVYNCNHKGQLSYAPDPYGEPDKEWMEYQVLRILAHLGEHNQNVRNPFPTIKNVKRFRDSDDAKERSRMTSLILQFNNLKH